MTQPGKRSAARGNLPLIAIFAAAGLLLIAGLVLLATGGGDNGSSKVGPRLAVDRERIDFGRVPLGKTVQAKFELTNTGDKALTLDVSTPVQVLQGC